MNEAAIEAASKEAKSEIETVTQSLELIRSFKIDSEERKELAAEILRDIKARYNAVEEQRTGITKPLLATKRRIDALFKPLKDGLQEAERQMKSKIAIYVEERAEANRRALEAVAGTADEVEAAKALADIRPAAPPDGVSIRHTWDPVITNPNEVPREYCMPDVMLLKQRAHDRDGQLEVPGVKFVKRAIVSSRK